MKFINNLKNLIFGSKAVRVELTAKSEKLIQPRIFTTAEEGLNYKTELRIKNQDLIGGFQFLATMQLRTPLRVLLRHDEIHTDKYTSPPDIAYEMWEGMWDVKLKTYSELGIDFAEPLPDTHASSIGPVLAAEYVPFLIAIRKIVELRESIQSRIDKLNEMLSVCDWQEFVDRHGGAEKIVEYFFPKFMNLAIDLDTPNRIAAASDTTLLAIKGVGKVKLKAIRERCASITENRDNSRLDCVLR